MIELAEVGRSTAILLLVVGLMLGLAWGLKRLNLLGPAGRTTGRRLAVVESLVLDPRNRLVVLRHDDEEHLVLVGPQGVYPLKRSAAKPGEGVA